MSLKSTRLAVAAASALLAFATASSAVAGPKGQGGGHGRGGVHGAPRGGSMGMHGSHGTNARATGPRSDAARDEAGDGGPPFPKFKGLDTNRDGVLSSDEAGVDTDLSADFNTYDRNADGI